MAVSRFFIIGVIFLLSLFVNCYRIPQYLFFSHEQGRDAIAAEGIYTLRDPTLIGPRTEIAGFFTSPWYYYLMAIPYGISGGNPFAASFFLTFLYSTGAVIVYFLVKNILGSHKFGLLGAIFSIFSFEMISYGRWLSNVVLAVPFCALAFLAIWLYYKKKRGIYFIAYGLFALLASQFQVVLIFQFIFVYLALLVLGFLRRPSLREVSYIFVFAFLMFLPLVVFDFRNEHITTKSIAGFLRGSSDYKVSFDIWQAFATWFREMLTLFKRTIFNFENKILLSVFFGIMIFGIKLFAKDKSTKKTVLFCLVLSLMSFGILIFNIGLTQLYIGTGIALIVLFCVSICGLLQSRRFKILAAVLILFWAAGVFKNLLYLHQNRGMFFVTIAEGLNYKDQTALLKFIHEDANGQEYRFEAYTLPYLKPEGWNYLHSYLFGDTDFKGAGIIYVAIEKNVDPFWETRWNSEFGETELVFEKKFGEIGLQKRVKREI